MELECAQRRPTSFRPPEAIRCGRPMVADKCATLTRLMAHHNISIEPYSLEASGVRTSRRATAMGETTNLQRIRIPDVGGNEPVVGPPCGIKSYA